MKVTKVEIIGTWIVARMYLAVATLAAVLATMIIWVGNKFNERGQHLAEFLRDANKNEKG
jgi:hypothetical protein